VRKLLRRIPGLTDEYTLELDWSSLECFTVCPRSAMWRLVYSRSTFETPALTFGKAIHGFLEHHYRHGPPDAQKVYELGLPHFTAYPPPDGEWRTLDHYCRVAELYMKEYPVESFTPVVKYVEAARPNDCELSLVECPFAIPLQVIDVHALSAFTAETILYDHDGDTSLPYIGKIHVVWTGVIDLVANQSDGSTIIVDHKTSSITGDSYFKGYELSQQFIGYAFAASQLLETPITKALLNVLACRKPTKTGKAVEFQRRLYLYREDQLAEWPLSILAHVEDLLHRLTTGFFPMSTQWCVGKYGTCSYHDVCTVPEEQRMTVLYSNSYADNTWQPLNQ
jgi:hypothetical protein